MANSLLRTDKEITELYKRHKETITRVCFAYMKNATDTEDALQDMVDAVIQMLNVIRLLQIEWKCDMILLC